MRPSGYDQTRTTLLRNELSKTLSGRYKNLLIKIISLVEKENPKTLSQVDGLFPKFGKEFRSLEPAVKTSVAKAVRTAFMKGTDFATSNVQRTSGKKISLAFNLKHRRALMFVEKMAFADVSNINNDIKNYLRRNLYEAIDKNEGIQGMTDRIQNMFGKVTEKELDTFQRGLKVNPEYRAKLIARTSVLKAYNEGALEQYRQSGIVTKKKWLTGRDERVCPWCGPLNGKAIPLESNFISVHNGKKLTAMTPPLHPQCRCVLLAVV